MTREGTTGAPLGALESGILKQLEKLPLTRESVGQALIWARARGMGIVGERLREAADRLPEKLAPYRDEWIKQAEIIEQHAAQARKIGERWPETLKQHAAGSTPAQ